VRRSIGLIIISVGGRRSKQRIKEPEVRRIKEAEVRRAIALIIISALSPKSVSGSYETSETYAPYAKTRHTL